jgi:hypothetical protein
MPSNEAPSGETLSSETMSHLPKARQLSVTASLESTAYGMNSWWHKNFPQAHHGRTVHRGPFEAQTVGWIDDRNEARRLGTTVEELEISRSVARRMGTDQQAKDAATTRINIPMTFRVSSPRYHVQITGITE